MLYAAAAVERAMKVQQVIMQALSGAITWVHAAEILGLEPRSVRRWRARLGTAWGLPIALYTDRAGWAFYTPKAGGPVDRTHPTQVGRALAHLGIEHIGAYSPQARGRGERLNRTVQGRLVNELHLAGITTVAAATAYLTERFIPDYNDEFAHPPADPRAPLSPCTASTSMAFSASTPSAR